MSYFAALRQDVRTPTALQSTANINAGVTSAIGSASTLNVAGIQWNLYADQNCTIFVDQSSDNVNWRWTDDFKVYAGRGGKNTVQATGAYVRIRVRNDGLAATTTLELCVALCPVVEAVPPALSEEGNHRVGVYEIETEEIGQRALVTPMNALKVVQSERLVGTVLCDPLSPDFWTTTLAGSGAVTLTGGQHVLSTGATSGSSARMQTTGKARYIGGASNMSRTIARRPAVVGANVMRIGIADAGITNGAWFNIDNVGGLSVVTMSGGVPTAVPTGSFNGTLGPSYVVDANVHTWEILYTNGSVWFWVDGELLQRVNATLAPWTQTMHLSVLVDNTNGANINVNTLNVRTATISRLGPRETQVATRFINTLGAFTLKNGPGIWKGITFGTIPTGGDMVVTVYDNIIAAGTILDQFTQRTAVTQRQSLVVARGVRFNTGLTVVHATTAGAFSVDWE